MSTKARTKPNLSLKQSAKTTPPKRNTPFKSKRRLSDVTQRELDDAGGMVRSALMLACNEVDKRTGHTRLRMAADAMVRKALDGNVEAFKVIAERIDGKPKQQVDMTGNLAVTSLGEAHLAALQALTQVITKENKEDTKEPIDVTPTKLDSEDS